MMQTGQGVKLLNILRKYCEGEKNLLSVFSYNLQIYVSLILLRRSNG
jgi:hypothetical protein